MDTGAPKAVDVHVTVDPVVHKVQVELPAQPIAPPASGGDLGLLLVLGLVVAGVLFAWRRRSA